MAFLYDIEVPTALRSIASLFSLSLGLVRRWLQLVPNGVPTAVVAARIR